MSRMGELDAALRRTADHDRAEALAAVPMSVLKAQNVVRFPTAGDVPAFDESLVEIQRREISTLVRAAAALGGVGGLGYIAIEAVTMTHDLAYGKPYGLALSADQFARLLDHARGLVRLAIEAA